MDTGAAGRDHGAPGLHRFAVLVCGATFILVFAGGLVTSTGSGLAVPDWPLSFGQFFPKMEGGVLFEHGHRLVAASVGMLVIALFVWARLKAAPAVATLAACALGTVILQGVLGGLTVLMKLPPAVSVAHACLAQAFLCLTVALAAITGESWRRPTAPIEERASVSIRTLALATSVAVYGQLILGAVMRHTKAGLAIPDFPLAFGGLIPPLTSPEIEIHFAHRVWAVVVTILVAWTAVRVLRQHRDEPLLRRPVVAMVMLLCAQITLGALTVWTRKAVIPTTLHVVTGAMVLAASFLLTLRSFRMVAADGLAAARREIAGRATA